MNDFCQFLSKGVKFMNNAIIWIFFLVFPGLSWAQVSDFSESIFLDNLLRRHPLAEQYNLLPAMGEAGILTAKGAFDPVLGASYYRKEFAEKLYYDQVNPYLVQPLGPLGMDVQVGMEANRGGFLNPENNTPLSGLAYGGIRIPLLRGMFMDQRRARLQMSYLDKEKFELERIKLFNELVYEGLKSYWTWSKSAMKVELLREVLRNNEIVLEGIVAAYEQGDRPAIDTLESFQQFQRITLQYNREMRIWNQSMNQLSRHLFSEDMVNQLEAYFKAAGNPITEEFTAAKAYTPQTLNLLGMDNYLDQHPNLRGIAIEAERLGIDEKFLKEQFKPRLDLNYNFLFQTDRNPLEQALLTDNYKAGLSFQFPLLLRTERGRMQRLKIEQNLNDLDYVDEKALVSFQVEAEWFALDNLNEQVRLIEGIARDAQVLYEAELIKFSMGESSVFLVNTRELQFLNAQMQMIDLKAEQVLQIYSTLKSMGLLHLI
jgi:outer membrane protein TolC